MKKNVMGKNLTQSILRSMGRYLAIVLIIALGSALFVGLQMTRTDMVQTGQVFTDGQNMFDLRLLSSLGWTDDQVEQMEHLEGLTDIEAACYQDAIVRLEGETADRVYRFCSIPERINQVALRGGRMPQDPDECLANGSSFDERILGTRVTLAASNEEQAFDALAYDTYTVVGFVATPLYMDHSRGTTTVGNGSIENYFYIPAEGFSAEYYTEVNVTVGGDYAVFSGEYDGMLDDMTAALEPRVQDIADRWFRDILDEAEAEYDDGYQEYLDGLADLEQGKLDAQQELDDAYNQLMDAEQEIADSEALLADGEKQLADGRKELEKAEKDLESGKKELEKSKKKTYAQLDEGKAELDANAKKVSANLKQVNDGLEQLKEGLAQVEDGISQLETGLPQLTDGIAQLEAALPQLEDGISQLEAALPQLEGGIAQLEAFTQNLTRLTQPVRALLTEMLEIPADGENSTQQLRQSVDTLHALTEQLRASLEAMPTTGEAEDAAGVDKLLGTLYELEGKLLQALAQDPVPMDEVKAQTEGALAGLDATLGAYDAQRQELEDMFVENAAQLEQLRATRTESEAQLEQLQAMYAQYSAQLEQLQATQSELTAQHKELQAAKKTLQNAQKEIDAGYKELEAGRAKADAEFAKEEKKLKNGQQEIRDGWATLESKEKELEDGRRELEEGKAELIDGWSEYEEGKLEAAQTIADAEAELADAAEQLAEARQEIDDLEAPKTYVLDRNTNAGYTSLESNADIVAGVSRVFPAFFLLIAALVCITTMSRMVSEERTQIGILKALGYGNGAIMSKYLIYAGTGGILGCGLGALVGSTVFPRVIWDAYQQILYIDPEIQLCCDWKLCAAVTLSYTAVVLAVTWYCCRTTLREVPAELIRPKAPTSGRKIFLEYLPFWNRFTFLNKVALRNVFRYRQRLLMMLIGISGCTALLVTGFGLKDSIANIVPQQYGQICRYDLEVYFDEAETPEELRAQGVEDALLCHLETVELDFGNKIRELTMLGVDEGIADYINMGFDGQTVAQPGPGEVVLSVGVSQAMGVSLGDLVVLRSADMQELHLTVSGIYENCVQNYAIVSPQTIESQWGADMELQTALVKVSEGADLHETSAAIARMDGVMTVLICQDNAESVGQMVDALGAVMWLILICAGLLAVIVLYNLININVGERIREIATIKVLGFHARETASYVFKENMVLTVAGALAGLGLGKLLLDFVLRQVKIDAVWFQSRVAPMSFVYSVALTLLATLVVQFIFTFKIERINMAEALKSVE